MAMKILVNNGPDNGLLPDSTKPLIESMLTPGGRLNKKDGLTRYGDSHVKDKTS